MLCVSCAARVFSRQVRSARARLVERKVDATLRISRRASDLAAVAARHVPTAATRRPERRRCAHATTRARSSHQSRHEWRAWSSRRRNHWVRTWRAWPFACAASLVASHHLASAIATPWWRRCPIARRAAAGAAARATPYCRHVVSARTSAPRVTRDTKRVALWRRVFAAPA